MPRAPLALIACLLLSAGCSSASSGRCSTSEGSAAAGEPIWLFEGHDYRWRELSHRLAFLRAGLSVPRKGEQPQVELGLTGGDWSTGEVWSDVPVYRVGWARLRSDRVRAIYGSTPLTVDATGTATGTVTLERGKLPQGASAVAALRGACFDADRPLAEDAPPPYRGGQGWAPRGLGAAVSEVDVGREQLRFDVTATFAPGAFDRPAMNHVVSYARVDAVIDWVVLLVDAGEVHDGRVAAAGEWRTRGDSWTAIRPLLEDHPVELQGSPGRPFAAPLLRSWAFELNPGERWPGSYLRGWSARLGSFDYDPDSGRAVLGMHAGLSNSSLLQESDLALRFRADLALLQLDDPDAELLRGQVAGAQESTGASTHPLDTMPVDEAA